MEESVQGNEAPIEPIDHENFESVVRLLQDGIGKIDKDATRLALELAGKRLDNLNASVDIITNKAQWLVGAIVVSAIPLITMAANSAKEKTPLLLLGYGAVLVCLLVSSFFGWKMFKTHPFYQSGASPMNMMLGYYLVVPGKELQEIEIMLNYLKHYQVNIEHTENTNGKFSKWLRRSLLWSVCAVAIFGGTYIVETMLFP